MNWLFYYLTSAKQNLELVALKHITLGYVYILIVNEWKLSKTKVETYMFTYNQFGSHPLILLNETAYISW